MAKGAFLMFGIPGKAAVTLTPAAPPDRAADGA
jgi:hypothetical protein